MSAPVSRLEDVHRQRLTGEIDARHYWPQVQRVRDHDRWATWGRHTLLVLAAAHLLAGVVTFIAANWQTIPPMIKLAAIGGIIVAAAAGASMRGLDDTLGRLSIFAAATLIGVWLAAFSQIYQTGADSYDLFLTWALLMLPWALAARSAAVWVLMLAVATIGLWLYADQVLAPWGRITMARMSLAVGAVLLGVAAVGEGARARGADWLSPSWARGVIAVGVAGHAVGAAIAILTERSIINMTPLPLAGAEALALWWLYRRAMRGLAGYTAAVAAVAAFIAACAIRSASELRPDWLMASVIALIAIIAAGAVAQFLMRAVRRRAA